MKFEIEDKVVRRGKYKILIQHKGIGFDIIFFIRDSIMWKNIRTVRKVFNGNRSIADEISLEIDENTIELNEWLDVVSRVNKGLKDL